MRTTTAAVPDWNVVFKLHPVELVDDYARAREQAGRVEVVHGAAARRLLEAGGGLGALLRYR